MFNTVYIYQLIQDKKQIGCLCYIVPLLRVLDGSVPGVPDHDKNVEEACVREVDGVFEVPLVAEGQQNHYSNHA